MVRRSPLGDALGNQRMFFNVEMAVARYSGQTAPHNRGSKRDSTTHHNTRDEEHDKRNTRRRPAAPNRASDERQGVREGARATARRTGEAAAVGRAQRAQGADRVRRPRRCRERRHDQSDHRTRQSAGLPRRRAAGTDRARKEPDVRAALPAALSGRRRGRDLRSQLVQPRRRRARDGFYRRSARAEVPADGAGCSRG